MWEIANLEPVQNSSFGAVSCQIVLKGGSPGDAAIDVSATLPAMLCALVQDVTYKMLAVALRHDLRGQFYIRVLRDRLDSHGKIFYVDDFAIERVDTWNINPGSGTINGW